MDINILIYLVCGVVTSVVQCTNSSIGREFFGGVFSKDINVCLNVTTEIAAEANTTVFYFNADHIGIAMKDKGYGRIASDCLASTAQRNMTDTHATYFIANHDAAVTVTSYSMHSAETALLLPNAYLGRNYTVATYKPNSTEQQSYIGIYSMNNATHVSIYNEDYTTRTEHTLNARQSLKFKSDVDISGYNIVSNKPVSVMSGTLCATLPDGIYNCDMLMETMLPADVWDTTYIVPPILPIEQYELRFLTNCHTKGTRICMTNMTSSTACVSSVTATKSFTFSEEATLVQSDLPVGVVQYGTGSRNLTHQDGDAFMTVIPGVRSYLNRYIFSVPEVYKTFENHIAIIIDKSKLAGIMLDDNTSFDFEYMFSVPKPMDNYVVVVSKISNGRHVMYHEDKSTKFGLMVYGTHAPEPRILVAFYIYGLETDMSMGYGYPAGLNLTALDGNKKITKECGTSGSPAPHVSSVATTLKTTTGNPTTTTTPKPRTTPTTTPKPTTTPTTTPKPTTTPTTTPKPTTTPTTTPKPTTTPTTTPKPTTPTTTPKPMTTPTTTPKPTTTSTTTPKPTTTPTTTPKPTTTPTTTPKPTTTPTTTPKPTTTPTTTPKPTTTPTTTPKPTTQTTTPKPTTTPTTTPKPTTTSTTTPKPTTTPTTTPKPTTTPTTTPKPTTPTTTPKPTTPTTTPKPTTTPTTTPKPTTTPTTTPKPTTTPTTTPKPTTTPTTTPKPTTTPTTTPKPTTTSTTTPKPTTTTPKPSTPTTTPKPTTTSTTTPKPKTTPTTTPKPTTPTTTPKPTTTPTTTSKPTTTPTTTPKPTTTPTTTPKPTTTSTTTPKPTTTTPKPTTPTTTPKPTTTPTTTPKPTTTPTTTPKPTTTPTTTPKPTTTPTTTPKPTTTPTTTPKPTTTPTTTPKPTTPTTTPKPTTTPTTTPKPTTTPTTTPKPTTPTTTPKPTTPTTTPKPTTTPTTTPKPTTTTVPPTTTVGLTLIGPQTVHVSIPVNGSISLDCSVTQTVSTHFTWAKLHGCMAPFSGAILPLTQHATLGDIGTYQCDVTDDSGVAVSKIFYVDLTSNGDGSMCTFADDNMCDWVQDSADDFDWAYQNGPTQSSSTGPDNDHTLGNGQGVYLFIETSAPRVVGEKANIISPLLPANTKLCLTFWYYMNGDGIGDLQVFIQDACTMNMKEVFTMSGDKGEQWYPGVVMVTPNDVPRDYRLIIQADVGPTFHGDTAIDDILISRTVCSAGQGSHALIG